METKTCFDVSTGGVSLHAPVNFFRFAIHHPPKPFLSVQIVIYFLFVCARVCHATGNKKLILKIGDDRESSFGSKIDVYFNLREGQVYPLGLFSGTEVELTWLCLRKTQKTGRLYCTSTLLTSIRLLKIGRNFGYK